MEQRGMLMVTINSHPFLSTLKALYYISFCISAPRNWCLFNIFFSRLCIDGKDALYPRAVETSYTNCHSHAGETYCTNAHGEEVVVSAEDLANGTDDGQETRLVIQCVASEKDYHKELRIGTIFIVLVTSSIGKAPFLHCLHILE